MKIDEVKYFARLLGMLSSDCYNADIFLVEPEFSISGPCQTAVETLYRFERCGLVYAPWAASADGRLPKNQWIEYLINLFEIGSYYFDSAKHIDWVKYDLCATKLGIEMAGRFKLKNCNEAKMHDLSEYLESLFAANQVSKRGLFPALAS